MRNSDADISARVQGFGYTATMSNDQRERFSASVPKTMSLVISPGFELAPTQTGTSRHDMVVPEAVIRAGDQQDADGNDEGTKRGAAEDGSETREDFL